MVHVIVEPGVFPLANIEIDPPEIEVQQGDTATLTATASDAYGNPVHGLLFLWEADFGLAVDQTGMVTAGDRGGRYLVSARASYKGGPQTASATVGIPPWWMPAGNMAAPRRDHVAVLLDDGMVLIVGGTRPTAELYDPATQSFTLLGSVPFREGVSAIKLANGNVLVVGEWLPAATATIYNPATRQFTPTGTMEVARLYSSLTLLSDGKVIVAGGQVRDSVGGDLTVSLVEVFDPATGNFTVAGSLNQRRSGHGAVLLPGGNVLIIGGTQTTRPLDIAELYDPSVGEFELVGRMTASRHLYHSGGVLLTDGRVLVAGGAGASAELFDPVSSTFSRTGDMGTEHRSHSNTLLPDGKVLVVGAAESAEVESYDPLTERFSPHSSLPEARQHHTATLLPTGRVLIIGGNIPGREDLSSALIYVP